MPPTNKVEFDIQDYLRDMEARLIGRIAACHDDVRLHNGRIMTLESQQYKLRWLWRAVTALLLAAGGWVWAIVEHHAPSLAKIFQ